MFSGNETYVITRVAQYKSYGNLFFVKYLHRYLSVMRPPEGHRFLSGTIFYVEKGNESIADVIIGMRSMYVREI